MGHRWELQRMRLLMDYEINPYKSCMSWYQLISLDISDEYLSMLNDLCNLHDTRWLAINWLTRVQATIDPQSHLPPQAEMPRLNCGSAAKRPFSGGCTRGVSRSWQCWAWMLMVEAPPKSKVRRDEFEQHMKPEAMSPEKKSSTKHWLCVCSILVYKFTLLIFATTWNTHFIHISLFQLCIP